MILFVVLGILTAFVMGGVGGAMIGNLQMKLELKDVEARLRKERDRAEDRAVRAESDLFDLQTATVEQAIADRLIEPPKAIEAPDPNKKHICGCEDSQAFHDDGVGTCHKMKIDEAGWNRVCGCQVYVEVE